MKLFRCFLTLVFVIGCLSGFGQQDLDRIADSITSEGKKLYASERTSWDGTDLFLEKFKDRDKLGGYFSYVDQDSSRCIFYSRGATPQVIGSVSFDNSHDPGKARVDFVHRDFNSRELPIYRVRAKALAIIQTDSFFTTYQKTNLNLIPIVNDNERRVVVLTGPEEGGTMIFGNDYELRFDENDQLISKRRLHHNILESYFGSKVPKGTIVEGGYHNHNEETGPFITATDICTLLLYEKVANFKTYTVISKDFVSSWDCGRDAMVILTMTAWKRIIDDQKKRHGDH